MAISIDTRFYQQVAANNSATNEHVPANGKKVYIYEIGGNSCFDSDVKVEIKFGTDILFSTHGDSVQKVSIKLVGDGEKVLAINLVNDASISQTIGGFYNGTET